MQTKAQAEQLYKKYEKYIKPTIYKKFPLHESFAATHGLDTDDLFQYARIGLYRACKSFDPKKGKSMRNHAIQSIIWSINVELKKDSLNNVDNKSLVLMDKNSLDIVVSTEESDELSLHDVLGKEDRGYNEVEMNNLLDSLSKSLSDNLVNIIKLRYKGFTFKEIGEAINQSPQYCDQLLKRNKEKIRDVLFA